MLHEDQCVCYMKTNVYVTWRPMCMLHEDQCVRYMNTNVYVTWRPMGMLHEDQCMCYMKTNVYVTWRPMCMLHEDQCVCYMKTNVYVTWRPMCIFIIARWILFRMRGVWTKVVDKVKTHILCSITFFKNRAVYEILWKNTVQQSRPQMTIWHMHIACWIPTATNTRSEYVILMDFPLQQWLHGCTSVSYYMYIACLVITEMKSVYCTVHSGCWNKADCASCLWVNCRNHINWNGPCASYCVCVGRLKHRMCCWWRQNRALCSQQQSIFVMWCSINLAQQKAV